MERRAFLIRKGQMKVHSDQPALSKPGIILKPHPAHSQWDKGIHSKCFTEPSAKHWTGVEETIVGINLI